VSFWAASLTFEKHTSEGSVGIYGAGGDMFDKRVGWRGGSHGCGSQSGRENDGRFELHFEEYYD